MQKYYFLSKSDFETKKMTEDALYESNFKEILAAKERMVTLLDHICHSIQSSSLIISDAVAKTTQISYQLPIKGHKKGFFFKAKAIKEIPNMESQFSPIWEKFFKTIIPHPGLKQINENVIVEVVQKVTKVKEEYEKRMNDAENSVLEANQKLKLAEENKNKTYSIYSNLVKQIEEIKTKLQPSNSTAKNQDYTQKLNSQLNELKSQYSQVLQNSISAHNDYNDQRLNYSTAIESALLVFEESDKIAYEKVHEISIILCTLLKNFDKSKHQALDQLSNILLKPEEYHDFDTYCSDNNITIIPEEEFVKVKYVPEKLPFDVYDFVSPEKLYSNDTSSFQAKVIKDFKGKKGQEYHISVGQIVTVIKRKASNMKIIFPEINGTGYVPSKCLEKIEGSHKFLMKITDNYTDNTSGLSLKKNSVVVIKNTSQNQSQFINEYHECGEIPVQYLVKM
ncbi:hypothetical protein TRFO_31415 [Tritrichomonas foetus]|uniref:SH3 domain-containing protein n=1 Tax=Tritrichomonas foetus TaxID=1144522 RepID=A0A1J4JWL3_9EUKA|nr:hypothetical protein TRFO_31415 [Tritrichomonas foetus]|eukprot:OHT01677.1 hypothetical protein TRFO_31415 [Tritrichomonas foetus]